MMGDDLSSSEDCYGIIFTRKGDITKDCSIIALRKYEVVLNEIANSTEARRRRFLPKCPGQRDLTVPLQESHMRMDWDQ